MPYRVGIDAGSKTIKVVVVDEAGAVVHSLYRRHRSDIRTTLVDLLHDLNWRYGDLEGRVAVTGSAGIALAQVMGLPFVQEVVATTQAVKERYPQADCVIELGGEDAKVIYLTGGLEQRMNATCAGGTGGFIDTIAHMIGSRTRDISRLALGSSRIYPIASRCAVFAQSDVRPLLNAGAKKSDIAASVLEAVVKQTLGGLACGRPIRGTVVFLGGPIEKVPYLVMAYRRALGLDATTGIKPHDAHLMTAYGAALHAGDLGGAPLRIGDLEKQAREAPEPEDDLGHLPPLFENDGERAAFARRHEGEKVPRGQLSAAEGPLYLGVDAGSTTVKCVLLDEAGSIVYSDYRPVKGDALASCSDMMRELWGAFPRYRRAGHEPVYIAHATATGYGENLLRAGLGIDSGVVETTAHVRAAAAFRPDVSFVLDIGGQDMKALWVNAGQVSDAVLNEACSSGCGSFVEGTAHSLGVSPTTFSAEALQARHPLDLGTKCTVFMTSRVRHAQKTGAERGDIAAGIAYSVVENALYRIIGRNRAAQLGDVAVVQGGTFKSDAVLRAFEKVSGVRVVRPDMAHLMGAWGCALVARDRAHAIVRTRGASPRSGLLSSDDIRALEPKRRAVRCNGCSNACALSVVDFGNGRRFISGNKCARAEELLDEREGAQGANAAGRGASLSNAAENRVPNALAAEQGLIARFGDADGSGARGTCVVGIMNALNQYESMPFWHTLINRLGFAVAASRATPKGAHAGSCAESIPSESVCQPAKLVHARYFDLMAKGANVVFMPRYERGTRCAVSCEYAGILRDNARMVDASVPPLVSPQITGIDPFKLAKRADDVDALFASLAELARPFEPLARAEFDRAFEEALDVQKKFEQRVEQASDKALSWAHEKPGRHVVVVAGRPYHVDEALIHGIDQEIQQLGVAVVPQLGMARRMREAHPERGLWSGSKHLLALASLVEADPALEVVFLRSFGCLIDAVSADEVRERFVAAGRPFTELKIDDIEDTVHIRIRLRTLVEALERRDARAVGDAQRTISSEESAELARREDVPAGSLCAKSSMAGRVSSNAAGHRLVPGQAPSGADAPRTMAGRASSSASVPLDVFANGGIDVRDLDRARAQATSDLCFTAAALAAHAANMLDDHPDAERIAVPDVCKDCLVGTLPFEIKRMCGRTPEIVWTNDMGKEGRTPDVGQGTACEAGTGARAAKADAGRLVGIVGNPLLVYDPFMNDRLVSLLQSLGCRVVMPKPENLYVDDVRYLDQLEAYERAGVRCVIYVQSFGCLKGHVQARGALHDLKRRFPDMTVTVIDYDPESSALNRENRVRLAVWGDGDGAGAAKAAGAGAAKTAGPAAKAAGVGAAKG